MSTQPESPRPFYRRPLVLIIAGAVVVILIVGGLVAFVANNALAPRTLADSGTSSPAAQPSAATTPAPKVTVTVAPTATATANPVAAPPVVKPPVGKAPVVKPPVVKPPTKPVTKPTPIKPTITNFKVSAASALCGNGATSVSSTATWTSKNAMRGSLKAVASYPSTSSHAAQTSTIVLNSVQGPLTFSSSCQFAKIVFTLTLEYIVNSSPTYTSATSTLVLY
jgi:hypothetical protein